MKRILALCTLVLGLGACKDSPTETDPFGKAKAYAVGDRVAFNVRADSACVTPSNRTGRVVAITQRAVVVADEQNPAGGFTDEEYAALGGQFDNFVYPVVTRTFGEPADVDRNERVVILFTSAVNDLTRSEEGSYVGGFFFARDLFPKKGSTALAACGGSNEAEMFYMRVPDPARKNFGKEAVARTTVGVLGHEFQHLINASRRLFVLKVTGESWNETVWLNEGLSHVAEELLFYAASGLGPRQNVDIERVRSSETIRTAFNNYQISNFGRLLKYYEDPEGNSPYQPDDDLATRAATWQFLRYTADRRAGDDEALWKGLVNSTSTGMANLRAALGTDPMPFFRDWAVSVYTDDAVNGVPAPFTEPSWHFRSVASALRSGTFPLRVRPLASGAPTQLSLVGGGAAYLRLGVAPAQRGEVRVAADGAAPAGACQVLTLQVGQVHTGPAGPSALFCLDGGAAGAEFTVIPFHGSETGSEQLRVTATATGIIPVVGPPNPSRSPFAPSPALALSPPPQPDVEFERELRETEMRELSRLVPGGAPRFSRAAAAGPEHLTVSVVRTR